MLRFWRGLIGSLMELLQGVFRPVLRGGSPPLGVFRKGCFGRVCEGSVSRGFLRGFPRGCFRVQRVVACGLFGAGTLVPAPLLTTALSPLLKQDSANDITLAALGDLHLPAPCASRLGCVLPSAVGPGGAGAQSSGSPRQHRHQTNQRKQAWPRRAIPTRSPSG